MMNKLWKGAGALLLGVLVSFVVASPAYALFRAGRVLGVATERPIVPRIRGVSTFASFNLPLYQNGVAVQAGGLEVMGMDITGNVIAFAGGGSALGNKPELNFNQGGSTIFDDGQFRVVTDDFLFLSAPDTVFVQNNLAVGGGLAVASLATTGTTTLTTLNVSGDASVAGTLSAGALSVGTGTLTIDSAGITSTGAFTLDSGSGTVSVAAGDTLSVPTLAVTGSSSFPAGDITNVELANSSITVNAGSGLATGGAVALGGSVTVDLGSLTGLTAGADSLAVNYGSAANTAAQGSVALTGPTAGAGLTGGGGAIAVGAGGTFGTINIASDSTLTVSADSIGINLGSANTWTAAQMIDGSADAVQLTVQGAAGQTVNLFVAENSAGTDLFVVDAAGLISTASVNSASIVNNSIGQADIASSSIGAPELQSTTVTLGSYGSATQVGQFTVDGDGRLTAAGNALIDIPLGAQTSGNFVNDVTAGAGINVSGSSGEGWSPTVTIGTNAVTDAMVQDNITVASTTGVNAAVTRNVAGSFQPVWGDLTVGDSFGTAAAADSDFGAGMMGNILGTNNLVNANNYLAGVIGAYSLTGSVPSDYPKGGVLGIVGPGVVTNTADGAVVAVLDGDNGQVNATAAFKVMGLNSTAASGFSYGLDLFSAAHDGYLATNEMIDVADIRLQNGETISNEVDGLIDFGAANLATTGQFTTLIQAAAGVEAVVSDNTAGSFQSIAGDFTPGALFGTSGALDTDFGAGVMGNILGAANMTNTNNYLAGVIGHYSLTGTNSSTWPKGAVLAGIGDGSTTANGAVVAYLDGDSGATTNAVAAFKVMNNNSTASNKFTFGLDLSDAARGPIPAVSYSQADIRLSSGNTIRVGTGAPTASCTEGDLFIRTDGGPGIANLYVCDATNDWDSVNTTE